jgi:hypothetical protein
MSRAKNIPVKAFAEELESRLNALTAEDLRQLVRDMAQDVTPTGRRAFLKRLHPRGAMAADARSLAKLDSLLADIAALKKRIKAVMRDRQYETWRDYEDAEGREFYGDFASKLEGLFDRCRAAFDSGEPDLARKAYVALFEVLDLGDEYGRSVPVPSSVIIEEEMGRYLRAMVDTAPADDNRSERLLEAWGGLLMMQFDAREVSLDAVFEVSPAPIEGVEALLDGLIARLKDQAGYHCDAWFRAAVRRQHGTEGLAELARTDGTRRPHAWLDWLSVMAAANDPARLFAAAQEAFNHLPEGLRSRAAAADHWFEAASALGDKPAALQARWEAFRADPSVGRLLDLWETVDEPGRRKWLKRAADEMRKDPPAGSSFVDSEYEADYGYEGKDEDEDEKDEGVDGDEQDFDEDAGADDTDDEGQEDDDEYGNPFGKVRADAVFIGPDDRVSSQDRRVVAACASLLAGDLTGALEIAQGELVLGWSSTENTQPLVLPVLFAWLAGWPGQPLTVTLAGMFELALKRCNDRRSGEVIQTGARFKETLVRIVPGWKLTSNERRALGETSIELATKRVNAILEGGYSGAYNRAATLAVGVAEILLSHESITAANQWLDGLSTRNKRKRSFIGELKQCREQMGKPAVTGNG